MNAAANASRYLPKGAVCTALGVSRASLHRRLSPSSIQSAPKARRPHARALSAVERSAVLDVLHSERFADMAPAAIYATLLDEGRYLCSIRTMYRILRERGEVRERRRQATHPKRTPPELVARGPNEVWTWDITHLRTGGGPSLKLYVCMDLYSRYVVGWYLSASETAAEARHLFQTLAARAGSGAYGLVVHADNGGPMRGKPLASLLESLGIERSHSRPRTSNDNAFSESQFKTMKYRPTYPRYFDSEAQARAWCRRFFEWYNNEHRHEGLALMTPYDVYTDGAEGKLAQRAETLSCAYGHHPQRFVRGCPRPGQLPAEVTINRTPKPLGSNLHAEATQLQEVSK